MSEPKRTPKERAADFVGGLRRIREDRGKLAALRRGLTDNPRCTWMPGPSSPASAAISANPVFVAIAALFASHPEESNARNFGETCRRSPKAIGKEIAESFERRFRRLLACGDVADVLANFAPGSASRTARM